MDLKEILQTLSDLRGISGSEYRLTDQIMEMLRPYADRVYTDALGSVIAEKKCGIPGAKKIMIEAHCDEIGLMVREISEDGFVSFVNIGGVDPRILPSMEVVIHGREELVGVIGAKPPHLQTADESKKSMKLQDMAVDTGLSGEQVRELISVGDGITLNQSCGELLGGQFSGKTLDDRAGVAALLMTMKSLERVKLQADVYAVAAVQEEVGCRGAQTAAYAIEPDVAIAVDVCHGITPDNSENAFETGCGTVISIGPNIHPGLSKKLFETAKNENIPYETDVDGGDTGTDAWTIQTAGAGVPTALLSIPLKYMHTSVETLSMLDVKATADLLTGFIREFDTETEGWLCI